MVQHGSGKQAHRLLTSLIVATLSATPAATAADQPRSTDADASLARFQERIRDVILPEDQRRACLSPTGSYAAGDEITVCADAIGQNRYRVPREVAVAPKEEDMMTPIQRGRAIMNAGSGPVGNAGDLGKPQGNPLMVGVYAYKFLEHMAEIAGEE